MIVSLNDPHMPRKKVKTLQPWYDNIYYAIQETHSLTMIADVVWEPEEKRVYHQLGKKQSQSKFNDTLVD